MTCPKCGRPIGANMWVNPTCPICRHGNAILEGICRDCKTPFPTLKGRIEWHCYHCEHRFQTEDNT